MPLPSLKMAERLSGCGDEAEGGHVAFGQAGRTIAAKQRGKGGFSQRRCERSAAAATLAWGTVG